MSILYNKTALKKMKKDDLVDMFLNRQANVLDDDLKKEASTELEKEYSRRISELIEIVNEKNQQIHNIISEHKQESTEQHQLIEGFNTSLMKLQDENQNLREEIQNLNFQVDAQRESLRLMDALDKQATDFCLQNQKLKEEIQQYKDSSLQTIEATPSEILAEMEDYEDTIETLEEQNEDYQDSIEEALNICGFSKGDSILDAVKKLKEQIKKFKEQNDDEFLELKEEKEELEEEIEELEAELKKLKDYRFAYDKEVWSPVELLRILDNYDLNWNGVCKEVEKLKEEKEELKTSLQTTTSYHTDRYELLEAELKKLKGS